MLSARCFLGKTCYRLLTLVLGVLLQLIAELMRHPDVMCCTDLLGVQPADRRLSLSLE